MRPPILRLHSDELIVDNFAGGGGASTGIEWALGRSPDIAVNHDPEAIAMHAANHPRTHHLVGSVWDVDPLLVTRGRRVGLAWFSPDCTFHSRARGGKPFRDPKSAKGRRGLAWVVTRWARAVRPRIILLENVPEFLDWGPLLPDGRPDPDRAGLTFRRWAGQLRAQGYEVEARELRACDFGAPTTRRRLFVVARCDGQPIRWPEPTHGPGRARPFRTAAECIDWTIPAPSIFERERPLADKTLRRIARGLYRFVVEDGAPFIFPVTHEDGHRTHGIHEPLRTITGAHRGEFALAVPTLIQTGYGEREGQAPRALDIREPIGTIVAGGAKHALVVGFLAKHYGGNETPGSSLRSPLSTITTIDHHALVTASVAKGRDVLHAAKVRALLERFADVSTRATQGSLFGGGTGPLGTVRLGRDTYQIVDVSMRMLQPRELFSGNGFPGHYIINPVVDGERISKTAQIRMCGNSVPPQLSEALARANGAAMEVAA